ncbi:isocitrate lyase/phosphoenolpyruvate mutase family protein [Emticicia sp. BO119]|uniref:isocitrate lyase/PEP mutase family protein n=1 Tax=Emticicia sp. BO119 TaxID=2757768 RepID=UPI0015F11C60|nr:isocitrate lyase/phosphoenolpyruvate mutase family protein [Emticicia sp. BO119]MBA4852975.1 isocitrate lyase/phosphoenolpyruvate mutase family protein [Emticicia sp. BO119]
MTTKPTQKEKALKLYALHHTGKLLILPNIWDTIGALLLESLQFPAIATASASIAYSNGYNDGEQIPFSEVLIRLKQITKSVDVPVTADVESAYATTDAQLRENIGLLLDTGIAGINIEDTNTNTHSIYTIDEQCNRIRIIKEVAKEKDVPLFINARTDILIHGNFFSSEDTRFEEIVKRSLAYKDAGANCFYPILMKEEKDLKRLVEFVDFPINVLTSPGIPSLKTLEEIGIARVSLGPNYLKLALKTMKDIALKLKDYDGITEIINNDLTSDYVKGLVNK